MFVLSTLLLALAPAQQPVWSLPPIEYGVRPSSDRVARLEAALEAGERTLVSDGSMPTIEALLTALEVPASSQTTVFTRTSFQARLINPRHPRALYFSDDVYLGFVPGSKVVEIIAVDVKEGLVFYTFDRAAEVPHFQRETHRCLQCHAPARKGGLPAHILRSLHPAADGQPLLRAGSRFVDHTTPYAERWGGWYVTGDVGEMEHLGNQVLAKGQERLAAAASEHASLDGLCDVKPYAATTSDIVALLVLEHQTHAQNAIVWAGYEAQRALFYQRALNEALGEPEGTPVSSTETRLDSAARKIVDALLFVDEPELTNAVGEGSVYAAEFQARGLRDAQGRSLRDLDLKGRLFRYPLSYTIDSEVFEGLPAPVRDRVWRRLWLILTDSLDDPDGPHLALADRTAIHEILTDTHGDSLPSYW